MKNIVYQDERIIEYDDGSYDCFYDQDIIKITLNNKNKIHNIIGPAVVRKNKNEYWIDGEKLNFITNDQELAKYMKLYMFS